MPDVGHGSQNRLRWRPETVVDHPLQVADPDGDLRELVSVGISLYPVKLLGTHPRKKRR